jgi:peptide-methionine (S)-S-oxide reductase
MIARTLLLTFTLPLVGFACCGPDAAANPAQPAAGGVVAAAPAPKTQTAPTTQTAPKTQTVQDTQPAASAPQPNKTTPPTEMHDANDASDSPADGNKTEVATFGGGCFWCTEAVLEQLDGVQDVTSGYMGGEIDDPTYQQVCSGTTGHAEVVQVTFDPEVISYQKLLEWFFRSHDPTTLNRQGYDVGTQYRSAVFFHSEQQHKTAVALIEAIGENWQDPIVTEVTEVTTFWSAEKYHQDYYRANAGQRYCRAVILPKLKKLGLEVDGKEAAKR